MRNTKKIVMIFLVIVVVIITFYSQYNSLLKDIENTAKSKEAQINRHIDLSKGFVDLMTIYGNDFFKYDKISDSDLYSLLTYDSSLNNFNLDSAGGTKYEKIVGNLTGAGSIPISGVNRDEVNLALQFNQLFSSVYKRIPDVAWIYHNVKSVATYTGTVAVTMKNGANEPWVNVGTGTFAGTDSIPVSGADFAAGKDTMFYKFVATQAGYTETATTKVIVQNPTFLFKRSAVTLTVAAATGGRNLLTNASIKADSSLAMLAIDGSLVLQGGSVWDAVAGNSIEFVPTTKAKYDAGRSDVAMTDFAAGTPAVTIDTKVAPSYYIFKMVKGAAATDVYYGMIYITGIVPSTSATIEYKIGNQYEHLLTIK